MANKNKIFAYSLIIGILLISAVGLFFLKPFQQTIFDLTTCSGTSTILSINNIDTDNENSFSMYITPNNKGECLSFTPTGNTLEQIKTSLKEKGYGLTLEGEANLQKIALNFIPAKQTAVYSIRNLSSSIRNIRTEQVDSFLSNDFLNQVKDFNSFNKVDDCRLLVQDKKIGGESIGANVIGDPNSIKDLTYCYQSQQLGYIGRFADQYEINSKIDIYLGTQYITSFDNDMQGTGTFIEGEELKDTNVQNKFTIRSVGNINSASGTRLSKPTFDVFISNEGKFRLIEFGSGDSIDNEYRKIIQEGIFGSIIFKNDNPSYNNYFLNQQSVDIYNGLVTGKLEDKTSVYRSSVPIAKSDPIYEVPVGDANIISKMIVDISDSPIEYPTFIVDFDASYVKVIKLAGKPEITSCPESISLKPELQDTSLLTKQVSFIVSNVGENQGSFTPRLTCGVQPQQLGQATTIVGKGQSTTFTGTIQLGTDKDTTTKCTFTIQDEISKQSDSCSITAEVKAKECVESALICNVDFTKILTCKDKKFEVQKSCELGCIYGSTGAECRTKETSKEICGNGKDDNFDGLIDGADSACLDEDFGEKYCQNEKILFGFIIMPDYTKDQEGEYCSGIFTRIAFFLAIILSLLGLVLGYFKLSSYLLQNKGQEGLKMTLSWLFAFTISLAIYLFTLNLLYWGLAIAVIVNILIGFIPSKIRRLI